MFMCLDSILLYPYSCCCSMFSVAMKLTKSEQLKLLQYVTGNADFISEGDEIWIQVEKENVSVLKLFYYISFLYISIIFLSC